MSNVSDDVVFVDLQNETQEHFQFYCINTNQIKCLMMSLVFVALLVGVIGRVAICCNVVVACDVFVSPILGIGEADTHFQLVNFSEDTLRIAPNIFLKDTVKSYFSVVAFSINMFM